MNIDIIYFNEGTGHYRTAVAVQDVLESAHHVVSLVNITDIIPGKRLETFYHLPPKAKDLAIQTFYKDRKVDIVISVVSFFNESLCNTLNKVRSEVIYVTLVTDFTEVASGRWLPPGLNQHVIVGFESLVISAQKAGYPSDRIHKTSGMVVHRNFYNIDKIKAKQALGFDENERTGLVMFGGGTTSFYPQLQTWVDAMAQIKISLHKERLVFLCGKNEKAYELLTSMRPSPHHVFLRNLENVHSYTAATDYYIGKSGPGSVTEAIVSGNVVVCSNEKKCNLQEHAVHAYVKEKGLGLAAESFHHACKNLHGVFELFDFHRDNILKERMNAVFELPGIIENIKSSRA